MPLLAHLPYPAILPLMELPQSTLLLLAMLLHLLLALVIAQYPSRSSDHLCYCLPSLMRPASLQVLINTPDPGAVAAATWLCAVAAALQAEVQQQQQ